MNDRKLAKSPDSVVNRIMEEVPSNPEKMIVLRLLGDQTAQLLQKGRTNTDLFRNELEKHGLITPKAILPSDFTQLQEIQNLTTGRNLL
jgi:hypothetical protein